MPTNIRDPRSIITPEAFEIAPALLGTPLARPWRRLAALLIDLAVIGILTAVTSGLGLFIWGFVGFILLQMAVRRPAHRFGHITSVLYRGSIGCLGGTILLIVTLVGVASLVSRNERVASSVESALTDVVATGLGRLAPAAEIRNAENREEAEAAAQALLALATGLDPELRGDPAGMTEALRLLIPEEAPYTESRTAFAREMVERFLGEEAVPAAPAGLPAPTQADLEAVDALDLPSALVRYREGLEAGRTPAADPLQARLRERLLDAVAADTLARLQDALDDEARRRDRAEGSLADVREELEEERSGLVPLLRDIWEQAGSAIGLWSLYFTVTLTLFQGYTVGKRALGIRTVRLDGEPFTWWASFERAGGYVAGVATGFLGFAQVFWDSNRQCVHDKIVGTAVVVAGAAPLKDAVGTAWSDAPPPER